MILITQKNKTIISRHKKADSTFPTDSSVGEHFLVRYVTERIRYETDNIFCYKTDRPLFRTASIHHVSGTTDVIISKRHAITRCFKSSRSFSSVDGSLAVLIVAVLQKCRCNVLHESIHGFRIVDTCLPAHSIITRFSVFFPLFLGSVSTLRLWVRFFPE